jgi:YD repeat-containing protein
MGYDLANRFTSVATTGSPNQPNVTLTYTYDKNGNRLTAVDPSGTNTYVYDVVNRLTSLTGPVGVNTFAYDALSRRTAMTLPNGTSMTYSYDSASQVTQIQHQLIVTTSTIK